MKKSFEINLGGRIFNIDEDAYGLLKSYIEELRVCFSGKEEGEEIIADIELRLGELCEARMREGSARIIDHAMVVELTERIGRPESIAENAAEDAPEEGGAAASASADAREPWRDAMLLGKKLFRDTRNRVFGGVFGGIAAYSGINVWLLRVSTILLTLFVFEIIMPIIYVIVWLLLPYAKSVTDRMRMRDIRPLPGESVEDAWRREYERSAVEMLEGGGFSDNKGCLSGCIVSLAIFILLPVILMIVFVTGVLHPFSVGFFPDSLFSTVHSMLVWLLAVPIAGILLFCLVYYLLGKRGKVAPLGGRTRTLLVAALIVLASVLVYVAVNSTSPFGASVKYGYSGISGSQTTAEELERFIDRTGEEMSPEEIGLLKNYYKLADNYIYSKKCARVLWYHIASVAEDTLVPFVAECTELDDKLMFTLMPRDEWSGCMAQSSSVSQITVVSRSVGDAGLYCLIDTAAKHLRVDLSRCQNPGNVKVEMNSIPGWQVEVVNEVAAESRSEGCFALGLKSYRGVKIIKGTLPKLTIYETVDGEEQKRDILHTLYRSREMHD